MSRAADPAALPWSGAYRSYDLVKELVVALLAVSLLTVGLAVAFSSPDEKQISLSRWAVAVPFDFVATAATELDGTSATATYGAPYNKTPDAAQKIGPVSLQHIAGVTAPVDTAVDFVVRPLQGVNDDAALTTALEQWAAGGSQQQPWAAAYDEALQKAPDNDPAKVAPGAFGPVPVMLNRLLVLAQSGGLDGALLGQGRFYQTDYTKPVLFLADGLHLSGDQWGMMNETGSYPGQPWMWLYTFWYQVKPFSTSGNADALVWGLMMVLSAGLIFVPFLPGLRSVPRLIPIYRLVWRDYYRTVERR